MVPYGRFGFPPPLHVSVCGFDQVCESRSIDLTFGSKLHVTHKLASAFQDPIRIANLSATKKSHVDVIFEEHHRYTPSGDRHARALERHCHSHALPQTNAARSL